MAKTGRDKQELDAQASMMVSPAPWKIADRAAMTMRTEQDSLWFTPQMVLLAQLGRGLADPTRISILALLAEAERPLYGQELAERLNVSPQTISHQLSILKNSGLVRERREQAYRYYSLDTERIHEIGETLFADDHLGLPTKSEERASILSVFFQDGRLVSIPRQATKRRIILEELARSFEWGQLYDERAVNEILASFHEDVARLRRELVDEGIMMREHGRYWLVRPEVPGDESASSE